MKNLMLLALLAVAVGCGTDKPFSRGEKTAASQGGVAGGGDSGSAVGDSKAKEYFVATIHPKMLQNCAMCHRGGGTNFVVSTDASATYESAKKLIVAGQPGQSRIYLKAKGVDHGGGVRWADGTDELKNLAYWIMGEAQ